MQMLPMEHVALTKRHFKSGAIYSGAIVLIALFSFAGCLGQAGHGNPSVKTSELEEKEGGFQSISAFVNGSDVVVQLVHSDRKVHEGTAKVTLYDPNGQVVNAFTIDVKTGDYVDTGICIPGHCGIDKTLEIRVPLEISEAGYTASVEFNYPDGRVKGASAVVFYQEDL